MSDERNSIDNLSEKLGGISKWRLAKKQKLHRSESKELKFNEAGIISCDTLLTD
jgi:hypothetical protein